MILESLKLWSPLLFGNTQITAAVIPENQARFRCFYLETRHVILVFFYLINAALDLNSPIKFSLILFILPI